MKKFFFSLVVLLMLVGTTITTNAQGSSTAPIKGSTYTYTVGSLTTGHGDDVQFVLTLATANDPLAGASIAPSASASTGIWYTTSTLSYTDNDQATRGIDITWGPDGAGNNYRLWVVVQDGVSGCYNYRFIPISPVANTFDIAITAVGIGNASAAGLTLGTTSAGTEDCISLTQLINNNFDASGVTDNGSTYVYYRVELLAPGSYSGTWTYTANFTNMTDATFEYSADGTTWGAYSATTTVPGTDLDKIVYIRALIPVKTTSRTSVATISGQRLGSLDPVLVPDVVSGNNSDTYTIKPVPTIGTFSGI